MANKAIVFIDLLGVQKMWRQGGAQAVKNRIEVFNTFVNDQVNFLPHHLHREGEYTVILAGDSASILCQDFDQAIGIGVHFFVQAFFATNKMDDPFWLRGAISGWHNQYLTLNSTPINAKGLQIGTKYVMEHDYLTALALEKSGFRGMRLVMDRRLLSEGSPFTRQWAGFYRPLHYVARLNQCAYPAGEEYGDVLWMTETRARYEQLKGIMASRYKLSTRDSDEFMQASWTRVTFDQVDSLAWMCSKKPGTAAPEEATAKEAEPSAAPNGGPATQLENSGVTEPPSVS